MVEKIAEFCKTGLYLRRAVKSEKQETNFSFLFYFVIWKNDMEKIRFRNMKADASPFKTRLLLSRNFFSRSNSNSRRQFFRRNLAIVQFCEVAYQASDINICN